MKKLQTLTALFMALSLSGGIAIADDDSILVYEDKIDDSPGSLDVPVDGNQWAHSFQPSLNKGTLVSRENGSVKIMVDWGDNVYLPGSFTTSFFTSTPFIVFNQLPPVSVSDDQTLSFTWKLAVKSISTQNPMADFIADDDYRRGGMLLSAIDGVYNLTMSFFVTGTEIYAVHESAGQLLGGLSYPGFITFQKIADKEPQDVVILNARYDASSNKISWRVNGDEKLNINPTGDPILPVIERFNLGVTEVPFPSKIRLDEFTFGFDFYRPLFNADPDTGVGVLNNIDLGIITFPTNYHIDSYECFTSDGMPAGLDEPGFCPILEGMKTIVDFRNIKVELLNDDDSSSDDSSS